MKRRYSVWLALTLFSFFLAGCKNDGQEIIINSEGGHIEVQVEVAVTDAEKREGLMGREGLADGTGMLFVYEPGQKPVMWMKNMQIPLDMVFVGQDLKINHIEENVNPCNLTDDEKCALYQSPYASTLVLELPAGYTKKNGIAAGNQIELVGIGGF